MWPNLPYVILGAIALIAGLTSLFLPETKDHPLPDTLNRKFTTICQFWECSLCRVMYNVIFIWTNIQNSLAQLLQLCLMGNQDLVFLPEVVATLQKMSLRYRSNCGWMLFLTLIMTVLGFKPMACSSQCKILTTEPWLLPSVISHSQVLFIHQGVPQNFVLMSWVTNYEYDGFSDDHFKHYLLVLVIVSRMLQWWWWEKVLNRLLRLQNVWISNLEVIHCFLYRCQNAVNYKRMASVQIALE